MNRLIFFLFCLIFFSTAKAQSSYTEAMRQGDEAFNKQQYKTAINKYFAAEAFDPAKKDLVKEKVNKAFDAIEKLRAEAVREKKNADAQKRIAQNAKIEVDNALQELKKTKAEAEERLKELQELTKTAIGAKYEGGIIFAWKDPKGKSGLIAAETDLPGDLLTWFKATDTCSKIKINGYGGWRLPTQEELVLLYANRNLVGGFREKGMPYWSSTSYIYDSANIAWGRVFEGNIERKDLKSQQQQVRLIRDYVRN